MCIEFNSHVMYFKRDACNVFLSQYNIARHPKYGTALFCHLSGPGFLSLVCIPFTFYNIHNFPNWNIFTPKWIAYNQNIVNIEWISEGYEYFTHDFAQIICSIYMHTRTFRLQNASKEADINWICKIISFLFHVFCCSFPCYHYFCFKYLRTVGGCVFMWFSFFCRASMPLNIVRCCKVRTSHRKRLFYIS